MNRTVLVGALSFLAGCGGTAAVHAGQKHVGIHGDGLQVLDVQVHGRAVSCIVAKVQTGSTGKVSTGLAISCDWAPK